MPDARAIRPVHDSTVRADDVHEAAIVLVCALRRLVGLQTLGVPGGDVAAQSLRGGRAEFGRDARQWVFEEWKYRRGIFECVA